MFLRDWRGNALKLRELRDVIQGKRRWPISWFVAAFLSGLFAVYLVLKTIQRVSSSILATTVSSWES